MWLRKQSGLKIGHFDLQNPEAKRDGVNKIFTEVAATYAYLTPILSFGRDQAWKKLLIRQLPEMKNPQCLDLACGTGDITLALARKYPRGKIIGLDINSAMLARARQRKTPKNIHFVQKDMNHTGFKSGRFDIATGGYALRNAPQIEAALKEIYRVLKPGGYGVFLDFSKSPQPWVQTMALFCLGLWGAFWGLIFHGNPDIYGYIAASLKYFPDRTALKKLLSQTGFRQIGSRILFFGFLEIIAFRR